VLIIHDPAAEQQHFVREVTFVAEREPFGFVVPTPARPEVAKVATSPFVALRSSFPFDPPPMRSASKGAGTGAPPDGAPGADRGVRVLEITKVGSFTAFILAATDEKALAKWLSDNQLVSTPEADRWLAHYVRMGFFYVAMRYDPATEETQEGAGRTKSETVRISFATPVPYYPYFEPERPAAMKARQSLRLLELWTVTPRAITPIVARSSGDGAAAKIRWLRPYREGQRFNEARARLEHALDDELEQLLPTGGLVVQTFQDQKTSRTGMDDVLFAPAERIEIDAEKKKRLLPLLVGILDPALVPEVKK
jgi:hypothetical protein